MYAQSQTRTNHAAAAPATRVTAHLLLRQCACGQHTIAGECDGCREQKQMTLQRFANGLSVPTAVPRIVHEVVRTPGRPLDAATRTFMEARFDRDFSGVRLHVDGRAAESAQAVNARAYTVGQHVVFSSGEYRPYSARGRGLLAHELTHTIQQSGHAPTTDTRIDSPHGQPEAEANRVARLVLNDNPNPARADISPHAPAGLLQRLSTGAAIGIAIGAVAGVAAVATLIAALVSRSRRLMHWETNAPDVAMVDDPRASPPTSTILLPQSTRVAIIDEGANQSFNTGNQQWVRVRVTVGPFLNREGWVHRNQLESRPETEEVSLEQANEIFTALAHANIKTTEGQAPIPFHYTPDGCYARAHRMEEMLTEMGYSSEKVFALAGRRPLAAESAYAPDTPPDRPPEVVWAWHVAPIIRVRDPQRGVIETVIDPSLYDRPISLTEWEGLMGDARTFTRLPLSQVREAMSSGSLSSRYERVAVTAPRYTYGPSDLLKDESHEEAESEDTAARPRMTGYVHMVPVFELASFIRRQMISLAVNVSAIITAISNATAFVRQQLRQRFVRLLAQLRQRLGPDEAAQVDSALNQ